MIRWTYGISVSAVGLLAIACQSQTATSGSTNAAATQAPAGQAPAGQAKASVVATFKAKAESKAAGTVTFTRDGDKVRAVIELSNVSPGPHGIHIHEKGDCSAADFSSAGGHWNPSSKQHACPPEGERHPGDFGNIEVKEDGTARSELTLEQVNLGDGPQSLLGKSVILHEGKDDCHSQPSGESGGRLACAVIELK